MADNNNKTTDVEITLDQRFPVKSSSKKLEEQGVHPLLATLFSARGVTDVSEVRGTMDDILPPSTLKNCVEMASVLADCIVSQERVLIISDYDCDGATACAVLLAAFRTSGMNVDFLVPNRLIHGYGLTTSIVQESYDLDIRPDYIITVDAGITSNDGVALANKLGMKVLITDHHMPPDVLPEACLIVNPNQPGCEFASKSVAGCGVAWYVSKALADELSDRDYTLMYDPKHLLQFVALGTVADVVQLDKNNRILVSEGLKRIQSGECTEGIKAILCVAEKTLLNLSCSDISYAIGPRLNAAGRLSHMSTGINCLLSMRTEVALELANSLERMNVERKDIEKSMTVEAESTLNAYFNASGPNSIDKAKSFVLYEKNWHEGIIGILAGRIKEELHRPTFVICEGVNGSLKGSGRSIPGFHLKHALDQISVEFPDIMATHGGHAMAVGVTIAPGKVDAFRDALENICAANLSSKQLQRTIAHDGIFSDEYFRIDVINQLSREVWGQGFPEPVFIDHLEIVSHKQMGSEKQHLKMTVMKGDEEIDVVAFGEGERARTLPGEVTVIYKPSVHRFNGEESMQLMVEHFPSQQLIAAFKLDQSAMKLSESALASIEHECIDNGVNQSLPMNRKTPRL